jgi:hypothetical protein
MELWKGLRLPLYLAREMTITIYLPPDLEKRLRDKANAAGVAAEDIVLDAVAERLGQSATLTGPVEMTEDESQLLQGINRGLPESSWQRYHQLAAARRAETLTEPEHAELMTLTDQIELAHAERLAKLVQLARLRKVDVDDLMEELGIRDPGYA